MARGAALPAGACRYWLGIWPHAHSCAQAYMLESSSDAVTLRMFAGFLGLVLLAGYLLARRLAARGWARGVLPDGFAPTIAVSMFAAAGLGLSWLALMRGSGATLLAGYRARLLPQRGHRRTRHGGGLGRRLQRTLLRRARG